MHSAEGMMNTNSDLMIISLGIFAAYIILLVIFWILHRWMKMRHYRKLREKYFVDNSVFGSIETFTLEELQKATKDFHESARIGGRVYRGILPDKTQVAVKVCCYQKGIWVFSPLVDTVIRSKINYKNVARILGICFDFEVCLIVYEYISNGSLYEHIHGRNRRPLSPEMRIKAAAEAAAALAQLHSSIIKPALTYRNVKAAKILFDDNYEVKLSGFSPHDIDDRSRDGYLDPEYFQSCRLTEKSDVYSFGVVLAELLTRKRAFDPDRPEAQRMLAKMFASTVEAGMLHQILDHELVKEGYIEIVRKVADLANRCMRLSAMQRPTMKEVAMELEGLRIMWNHAGGMPSFPVSSKETVPLVTPSDAYMIDVHDEGFNTGSSSIRTNAEEIGYRRLQEAYNQLT